MKKGLTYPHSFHLSREFKEWCAENLPFGFKIVRVCWIHPTTKSKNYRYAIMFNNDKDMIYFKLAHGTPP